MNTCTKFGKKNLLQNELDNKENCYYCCSWLK